MDSATLTEQQRSAHALPGPRKVVATYVVEPRSGWQPVNLKELWNYRDLLWFLIVRDLKVRYKQTVLGALWALIQPLFMMIVFSVFFGRLGGMSAKSDLPYPVLTLCALIPWQLFSNALTNASNSLVNEQRLISKVYFPRLLIPLSSVLGGVADFAIAMLILLVMMLGYGIAPTWAAVTLPLFVLFALAAALAVSLWLSALNVQYRDVRYTLGFLTQIWLFATPVAYLTRIVPEKWRALYGLNPMVGVVDGFRWALLGREADPPGWPVAVSAGVTLVLLVGGAFYFRRTERAFADIV